MHIKAAFGALIVLCIVALLHSASGADEDSRCFYPSKEDDGGGVFFDDCGVVTDDNRLELASSHFENIAFDDDGLACVAFSAAAAFLVHESGRSRHVVWYDNYCDYFESGLVRGYQGQRMVFLDKQLAIVIDPGFEFVGHFVDGYAMVCHGPFIEESDGEHTFRRGGRCGLIDRSGKLVVEPDYPIEEHRQLRRHLISRDAKS